MSAKQKQAIGLALAGGGPLGAIYEIGALAALQESLIGVDFADCDVYVGVSAGAFVSAGLANGMTPRDLCAKFIESEDHDDPFEPDVLMRPALAEFARRLARIPQLAIAGVAAYVDRSGDTFTPRGFFEAFERLTAALPNGVFDNAAMAEYLARQFSRPGRTNDFRELKHPLYIVATDLDAAKAVTFGAPGFDDVPISEAIKASSALPGLFPPAHIRGRDYVDGALKKTLHASVALKAGVKLLFCVNPLTTFDADAGRRAGRRVRLSQEGLLTVMSQTFRALIQSRMRVGLNRYAHEFPDADIVLFEPAHQDAQIFFANIFSYADRRRLAEHAYSHTRSELRRRADELDAILSRHGVSIDRASLADPDRKLLAATPRRARGLAVEAKRLENALGRLDHALKQGAHERNDASSPGRMRKRHGGEAEKAHA